MPSIIKELAFILALFLTLILLGPAVPLSPLPAGVALNPLLSQEVKLGPSKTTTPAPEIISSAPSPPSTPLRVRAQGVIPKVYQPPPEGGPAGTGPAHRWNAYALEGISSSTFTQPKVVDLDLDGNKEVISALLSADRTAGCAQLINQGIYAWDDHGRLKPGFPVFIDSLDNPWLCGYLAIVATGDVIGDTNLEIVAATGDGVYVVSANGEILRRLGPPNTQFSDVDLHHAVLNDLDGDGKMEIIASSLSEGSPDQNFSQLYIWRGNGSPFPGWPIRTPDESRFGEPTIVDFRDGRGKAIIVVMSPRDLSANTQRVIAYNTNGQLRWSFNPLPLQFEAVTNRATAADLDGDGISEIILHSYIFNESDRRPIYHVTILDNNGNLRHQWPSGIGYSPDSRVSVGDLDNDEELEVIYHDFDNHRVYAADLQGRLLPGFPRLIWDGPPLEPFPGCGFVRPDPRIPPYCALTQLGVGDLDGDGHLDIYGVALHSYRDPADPASHAYAVFTYNRFGQTLSGFPYRLLNDQTMPFDIRTYVEKYSPTLVDLNNDGLADMVTSKGWGRVEVLTLNSAYRADLAPVPQYGVDERNTKFVPSRRSRIPPSLLPVGRVIRP